MFVAGGNGNLTVQWSILMLMTLMYQGIFIDTYRTLVCNTSGQRSEWSVKFVQKIDDDVHLNMSVV